MYFSHDDKKLQQRNILRRGREINDPCNTVIKVVILMANSTIKIVWELVNMEMGNL